MIEYSHYDSPMSPHSFMGVVHRRRKIIIMVFLIIVAAVVLATYLMPPQYRASAKVMINYQIEIEKEHLLNLWQVADRTYYERLSSEVVIFKMRSILEPVAVSLGLDQTKDGKPVSNDTESRTASDRAVEELAKRLKVEREKDTNVLVVSFEDENPRLAANIVQKVVEEFIKQRASIDRDERAFHFFDEQIKIIKERIDELEQKGMQYKSREKVLSPDEQTGILFKSLADFDHELSRTRAERISREAKLKVIREQSAQGKDVVIPSTETSNSFSQQGYLNRLKTTLLELELKKNRLEQKYTPKHPELAIVLSEIKATKLKTKEAVEDIIEGEEAGIKALMAEEQALAQRMNEIVDSVAKLSRQEYELGQLTIGATDLNSVYSMLMRQREEARIANSKKEYLVHVRLLEPALVPHDPVKPNRPLYISLAIFLGLVVAFGLAFFVEYFDHSVNTAEDAQNCLGLPILASISDFQVENYKRTRQSRSGRGAKPDMMKDIYDL